MASIRTEQLDYELPANLIATRPAEPRDSARMLVMRRSADQIEHLRVRDLPGYLNRSDLLVFNDTAVAPARLMARRLPSGAAVEGLFLDEPSPGEWRLLLKANRKLKPGDRIELLDAEGELSGERLELTGREGAQWRAQLPSSRSAMDVLEHIGRTPLPPYILRARQERSDRHADADDRRWYQTIYADASKRGSVAAPTAGLHFTPGLLDDLRGRGVQCAEVTLHVGPGTFKPVTAETLEAHEMHAEWYQVPPATLRALRAHHASSAREGRVIAVGTTAVRTLESLPEELPDPRQTLSGQTHLLIAPGYRFRFVDGMLTNFHLPRSTLLALVAAMVGLDRLLEIYREAVRQEYRFYSYGDAMLVLP